jgi:pyrroloquinoline quinone (PQQ) biosynthesis protein C
MFCHESTFLYDTPEKAIEAWNTRPIEDTLRASLATLTAERDAAQAEVERLRALTATNAMKLCPGCEKLTEHEKYCEVWQCRECGWYSESGFVGLP